MDECKDSDDNYLAESFGRAREGNRNAPANFNKINEDGSMTDVVNLETLMVLTYNLKLKKTPFGETHLLEAPLAPGCPFRQDLERLEIVRRQVMEYQGGLGVGGKVGSPFESGCFVKENRWIR